MYIYTSCCFVAELPFTVLWVHVGESCRSLLEAMEGSKGKKRWVQEILLLVLSIVLLVALGVLLRRYTSRYARLLEEEREKEEREEDEREEAEAAQARQAANGREGGGVGGSSVSVEVAAGSPR